MPLKPIRDKADLIAIALPHVPSAACGRAIREGRVELLGVFLPHKCLYMERRPPGPHSYIIAITSQHGKKWHLVIRPEFDAGRYEVLQTEQIRWEDWYGVAGRPSMVNGDYPEVYAGLRLEANNHATAAAETHFV
jgi:hypothetical protein